MEQEVMKSLIEVEDNEHLKDRRKGGNVWYIFYAIKNKWL